MPTRTTSTDRRAPQGMSLHAKLARLLTDMKLAVVCRRAGVSPAYLTLLLKNKGRPGADIALRLARVLQVDLVWLIDPEQGWPPVRTEALEVQVA